MRNCVHITACRPSVSAPRGRIVTIKSTTSLGIGSILPHKKRRHWWSGSNPIPLNHFSNPEQARGDVNKIKQAERQQRRQRAGARNTDDEPLQEQSHSLSGPTSSAPTQAASSVPRSTKPSTTPTQASSSGLSTYSAPTQAPSSALSNSAPTQASSSSSLPARPSFVPTPTDTSEALGPGVEKDACQGES
ncbi:hypothetical protein CF327_g6788 [Tilletia walkeri]|nr:hypothetical protein CF327_g6788 [Tilletia walkeri]